MLSMNETIRARRHALGVTQEQLADRLGVSAPAVSKWEQGASYPDVTLLPALARALGSERLQDVSVRLSGRGMIVRAVPRERALLETLEFKYHAELFERAFGIRARLKLVKRRPGAGNR